MSLSICLITRDAEHCLGRALRSIAFLRAEVLVGDTGSKDGTVTLARQLGANAFAVNWQDDFASAQNEVLARAGGEWILWLNPDEELLTQDAVKVEGLLARPEALAYVVFVQEMIHEQQTTGFVETWAPRLFRRHPELLYAGRLHPTLMPPLDELAAREGKQVVLSDLRLRRHAYLSTLTEDKLRWTCRLLEKELTDRPGQLHYLIEYGRALLRLNDPRGHEILAEATEHLSSVRDAPIAPIPAVGSLLEYLLTVSPQQSRGRMNAEQADELARRWCGNSPPVLWLLANRAFEKQNYQEAATFLERLLQLARTGTYDRSTAFDPSILAEPTVLNLGNCYLRLGDLERAESCFAQAFLHPAYQTQAAQGYALVQRARHLKTPQSPG